MQKQGYKWLIDDFKNCHFSIKKYFVFFTNLSLICNPKGAKDMEEGKIYF